MSCCIWGLAIIICLMRSGLDIMFCTKGFSMIWESISGLDISCRCICCWSSMKLAEPIPRLPSPVMPPKPAGEGTRNGKRGVSQKLAATARRGQAHRLSCIPTNPGVSCIPVAASSEEGHPYTHTHFTKGCGITLSGDTELCHGNDSCKAHGKQRQQQGSRTSTPWSNPRKLFILTAPTYTGWTQHCWGLRLQDLPRSLTHCSVCCHSLRLEQHCWM